MPYYNNVLSKLEYEKYIITHSREMIEDYTTRKLSIREISCKFNLSWGATRWCLLKHNVCFRDRVSNKFHMIDEKYFEKIDNMEKAYWLGWLFADGNNFTKTHYVSISLKESDKLVLENFARDLKSSHPIKTYIRKGGFAAGNKFHVFGFGNKKLSKDLENLGMVNRKSLILKFPVLEDSFIPAFLRGYLEGDGNIAFYPQPDKRPRFSCGILGTLEFITEVQKYLYNKFQIKFSVDTKKGWKERNINMYRATLKKKTEVLTFLKHIYNDCGDHFLPRKFAIYQKMLDYVSKNGLVSWNTGCKKNVII